MKPNFRNTSIAFQHLSNGELRRAVILFTFITKPFWVNIGKNALLIAKFLRIPYGWAVKRNIFQHFCGGTRVDKCEPVIEKLGKFGAYSILDYSAEGLRKILLDKNRTVVAQVNELKDKKTRLEISQEEYDAQVKELKGGKGTPVVVIKPLDNSNYDNLVSALDEMLIASVGKYAIADVDDSDKKMLTNSNVAYTAQ